jgi:hypothetical protein
MTAAEEFLRTVRLDLEYVQYMDITLVNGDRGLHVTINGRTGEKEMRVRQVGKDFVKTSRPKTPDDVRALGRWLCGV